MDHLLPHLKGANSLSWVQCYNLLHLDIFLKKVELSVAPLYLAF